MIEPRLPATQVLMIRSFLSIPVALCWLLALAAVVNRALVRTGDRARAQAPTPTPTLARRVAGRRPQPVGAGRNRWGRAQPRCGRGGAGTAAAGASPSGGANPAGGKAAPTAIGAAR